MNKLKEVWSEVTELLHPFGDVVIAGGSVRDFLMGRDPKDYDIFVLGISEDIDSFSELLGG